jgi:hypothetical protein
MRHGPELFLFRAFAAMFSSPEIVSSHSINGSLGGQEAEDGYHDVNCPRKVSRATWRLLGELSVRPVPSSQPPTRGNHVIFQQ